MTRDCTKARRRGQFKLSFAKRLRNEATGLERKLWSRLRGGQINGWRIRRQQPIGPYIVDFFCSAARLVIEIDGSQHGADASRVYDRERTGLLNYMGYRVLRFTNHELLDDFETVLEGISRAVTKATPPRTRGARSTLPQGEGD